MPVDEAYFRAELAALYDALNAGSDDQRFYLALPKPHSRILDVGCGTGELALAFAAAGHAVTAVDPAPGMLHIARQKDKENRVQWLAAMGNTFQAEGLFDLAVMSGHVFQVFLDDAQTLATLRNIRRHLVPGGRLAFESRNPSCRAWEGWTKAATRQTHHVPGIGEVQVHCQLIEADGEHVSFETVFHFTETGRRERSVSRLRFPSRSQIDGLLKVAGYAAVEWLGDWDGSPFAPESPEIIALAEA
jgi:ubiquinone/menaquinone biosynthesis C-methylase UbiE